MRITRKQSELKLIEALEQREYMLSQISRDSDISPIRLREIINSKKMTYSEYVTLYFQKLV